jgi:hypothetical protein
VALGGGTATELAGAPFAKYPLYLAVDATHVYWTNYQGGTVARVPVAGGQVEELVQGENEPWGLADDATAIYWTEHFGPDTGAGKVKRLAK